MPQLISKLERLRGMSTAELAHRLREQAYLRIDRVHAGKTKSNGIHSFRRYLAGAPSERFYVSHRQDLAAFLGERCPQWIHRAVDDADRLCRHRIPLLGFAPVELDRDIDWHRDPITGQVWERSFWADYCPVNDPGGRDSKFIHELNRHQHLPRLAKAYRLTGDERYAAEAISQLHSWIAQNPPEIGINWQSSLEIAVRAISWMWTLFLLLPSQSLDEASANRIGDSLFAQLEHVHRYTSLYSSPNTHLIGEGAALFLAGLVFKEQQQAQRWLRTGLGLLADSVGKQVFDDGVYGELSSTYHCYALDFYLQAIALARQNGYPLPEILVTKTARMLEFLMHLTRPDGTLPVLGDNDGGRALALHQRNYRSFRDGLCMGALLYNRGDFKHQAGGLHEESLWMLGRECWKAYGALEAHAPAATQSFHPVGGYFIQRSGWGPLDSHLVFDCGGLGMLSGGHAHADALSVTLFADGRELLSDSGTYVYNAAPESRRYFRSTRAHNTVTIDDLDQGEQGGTFGWKTRFHTQTTLQGVQYLEAEHDGYLRLPQPVVHRRRLLGIAPGCWLIADDFRGSGEHTFEFNYHTPPVNFQVDFFATEPITTQQSPAWISRAYGDKEPSTVLRASLVADAPAAAITFLSSTRAEVRQLPLEVGHGIACWVRRGTSEDIAVVSTGDEEIALLDFRLRGEFFWLRLEEGQVKQILAVRALSMHDGSNTIFRRSEPGFYFGGVDSASKEETLCAEFAGS